VVVESLDREGGCPSCGVLTGRVHQRTLQRVRDVPVAGAVEVRWRKRRFCLCRIGLWEKDIRRAHQSGPGPGPVHGTAEGRGVGGGRLGWGAVLEVAASFGWRGGSYRR
jgi:transposase